MNNNEKNNGLNAPIKMTKLVLQDYLSNDKGGFTKVDPQTNTAVNVLESVSKLHLQGENQIDQSITDIEKSIAKLQANDFTYQGNYAEGNNHQTIYIKEHNSTTKDFDPIHPDLPQIQALQYLKAMLLIAKYSGADNQVLAQVKTAYEEYQKRENGSKTLTIQESADNTQQLADAFNDIIVQSSGVKLSEAQRQLTMARDLGLLLVLPPTVVTVNENVDAATGKISKSVEIAQPLKIGQTKDENGDTYYDKYFDKSSEQQWVIDAAKSAGLSEENNWIAKLLKDKLDQIKTCGVGAPPSARWLPTPANCQRIDSLDISYDKNGNPVTEKENTFIRMAISSAFEIKDEKQQIILADEQIKEMIRTQLGQAIADYENRYDSLLNAIDDDKKSRRLEREPREFLISYQTLLSPFIMESLLYTLAGKAVHRDNNARFVEMAKAAIESVAKEYQDKPYVSASNNTYQLKFTHTNSSINRLASKVPKLLRKFKSSGRENREIKFAATAKLFTDSMDMMANGVKNAKMAEHSIKSNMAVSINETISYIRDGAEPNLRSAELAFEEYEKAIAQYLNDVQAKPNDAENRKTAHELATRMRASYYLRLCLDKKEPYHDISKYQRNIMIAALENIMLGKQGLKFAGCKSARDRTAVFASAVKGMLANPKAMTDWPTLQECIKENLQKGHHFRAMIYHNPIVKVGDVHKFLQSLLTERTQVLIKSLLRFGKKMHEFGANDKKQIAIIGKKNFIKNYLKKILHASAHHIKYVTEQKPVKEHLQKFVTLFAKTDLLKTKLKAAIPNFKKDKEKGEKENRKPFKLR